MKFVDLTAVTIITVLWDVMPCSLVELSAFRRKFLSPSSEYNSRNKENRCCLSLQDRRVREGVLFSYQDGGCSFLRNVGNDLSSPVELHLGRQ
jgi:hypothetical protein